MSSTEATIKVDATQVNALFKALTGKQQNQAIMGALRSSARILQKETESQFKKEVNLNGYTVRRKTKSGKEKLKWKRIATVKVNNKEQSAMVHIMADFRAKFFEMGTKDRRTKGHRITGEFVVGKRIYRKRSGKGGYRGKIKAGHFFRKAQELTEGKIFQNMDNEMTKSIIRIARRYNAA
jgi:hypothetical protein